MAKKIQVTQVKSMIDRPKAHKQTLKALGLGKMHRSVELEVNPSILGMVKKISHLVLVEEVS